MYLEKNTSAAKLLNFPGQNKQCQGDCLMDRPYTTLTFEPVSLLVPRGTGLFQGSHNTYSIGSL